jgi:hypothetical protein
MLLKLFDKLNELVSKMEESPLDDPKQGRRKNLVRHMLDLIDLYLRNDNDVSLFLSILLDKVEVEFLYQAKCFEKRTGKENDVYMILLQDSLDYVKLLNELIDLAQNCIYG